MIGRFAGRWLSGHGDCSNSMQSRDESARRAAAALRVNVTDWSSACLKGGHYHCKAFVILLFSVLRILCTESRHAWLNTASLFSVCKSVKPEPTSHRAPVYCAICSASWHGNRISL